MVRDLKSGPAIASGLQPQSEAGVHPGTGVPRPKTSASNCCKKGPDRDEARQSGCQWQAAEDRLRAFIKHGNYYASRRYNYLVSSLVNVDNLTIEGGTTVKYTNTGAGQIAVSSPIVCETAPFRPAVFTSMSDSSVGAPIGTGTISTNSTYLSLSLYTNQTLRNCRFSYANVAISETSEAGGWNKLWDCQFFDCNTAFIEDAEYASEVLYVYNVLFSHVLFGLVSSGSGGTIYVAAANVTADNMDYFAYEIGSSDVFATNSVFTAIGVPPASSSLYNCALYSSSSGVYQPTGAGGYYLTNGLTGSTNRGAGTANIDAGLLAELGTLTTYPPAILPTYITSNTNLSPTALRNTGTPDRGYHYPPCDYAVNTLVTNVTLTVAAGTVLAAYGNYGLQLSTNGIINFNGTATSPVTFARYNTIQEQSTTNWETAIWSGCLETTNEISVPTATFQFTEWCVLAGDPIINGVANNTSLLTVQNCQLFSGQINLSGQTLLSTNCLYQRVATTLKETVGQSGVSNTFCNNLFLCGSLTYRHTITTDTWTFRDNLFDQANITNLIPTDNINFCANN